MEVQKLESEWLTPHPDGIEQIIELAERLAGTHGHALDDDDIAAIVEATGAPEDYVRLALKMRSDKGKQTVLQRVRSQYLTLESSHKRYLISGGLAFAAALFDVLENASQYLFQAMFKASYGIFGMLEWLVVAAAVYNLTLARDKKVAAIGGAIAGAAFILLKSVLGMIFALKMQVEPPFILLYAFGGAVVGARSQMLLAKFRGRLGLKDPAKERQDMIRQLIDLQNQLRTGEQEITFMSIDMVGSTRMKEAADPLSIEFTFNEYHLYVERLVERFGGRVHSTAGDGITCAFEDPNGAFRAAKAIQTGLFEFNSFRNRIGRPVALRIGLHTGLVVPPDQGDVTSLNFAHVIDISAHLQKTAPPGGVAVSDATLNHFPGGKSTVGETRVEASGVTGCVWVAKQVNIVAQMPEPPGLPSQA
jgi:class 3 adenylate cyclase